MKNLQKNKKIILVVITILLFIILICKSNKKEILDEETTSITNSNYKTISMFKNINNETFNEINNNINTKSNTKSNIKVKLNYVKCSHLKLQDTLKTVFSKYNMIRAKETNNNWDLYIPCGYNYVETELDKINISKPNQFIYAIKGCDKIASKNELWKIIRNYYGREKASLLIPESFIINDPEDIKKFTTRYDENNLYLLKKNIQRKEGILILNDYNKIMNVVNKTKKDIYNYYNNKNNNLIGTINNNFIKNTLINRKNKKHDNDDVKTEEDYTKNQNINSLINNFKIIQTYISDLYIINKRKCNIRLYILITCSNNTKKGFLYKYGKCIYTNKDYKNFNNNNQSNSKQIKFNKEEHLTSYLLDQDIYQTHPETLDDLSYHMGNKKFNMLWENIIALLKNIFLAIKAKICNKKTLQKATTFQLFGADIIFTNSLQPYLLEFNKGPSMKYMNDTDKKMKLKLTEDVFKKVGIIPISNKDIEEFIEL